MRSALLISILVALVMAPAVRAEEPKPQEKESVEAWCKHLSQELMSVNYERCIGRNWVIDEHSQTGHPIPHVDFGKPDSTQRILVLGAVHGDEISAVSLVFRWLDFAERQPADSWVRNYHFLFYPLINADGFYAKPRTRTNGSGVDINRNFATKDWDKLALPYWKAKTGSDVRRFPGKTPASEVETRIIEKAIEALKPQLILSVHAPYNVLDHDGPVVFTKALKAPLPLYRLGGFPGSLGTYAGTERNMPVITPELPRATTLPDLKIVEDLFIYILKSKF